jgi:ubiquinone/menaquinone biosynthesis C-methylase UbiE
MLDFIPLFVGQVGPQKLERIPEPHSITAASDNVTQYNQVMSTKLALSYAAGIEIVHRARGQDSNYSAADLACGPGHYTTCLARYLGYNDVTGVDLSAPMVAVANQNAAQQGLKDRVKFKSGDITALRTVLDGSFDLVSFTGAAHHLADLNSVSHVLRQMDEIAKPTGLVMLMDLARLRTARLTERYLKVLAEDYVERGLPEFLGDFRDSMYAVWTPTELRTAIPHKSPRSWVHIVPMGLPTVQIILGLPLGRKNVFERSAWPPSDNPLIQDWYPRWKKEVSPEWARQTLKEWKLMRLTLATASKRRIFPTAG